MTDKTVEAGQFKDLAHRLGMAASYLRIGATIEAATVIRLVLKEIENGGGND